MDISIEASPSIDNDDESQVCKSATRYGSSRFFFFVVDTVDINQASIFTSKFRFSRKEELMN